MFRMRLTLLIVFLSYECPALAFGPFSDVSHRSKSVDPHINCDYFKHDLKEYCANCSYRGITEVPTYLLNNITCLNLVGNNITSLNGRVWQKYTSLKKLSLARNHLTALGDGDFYNLSELEMLDLSLNFIRYYNISGKAFEPLVSLKYFDVKQSFTSIFENETYPTSLQHLVNLRTLMIDGLDNEIPDMPNLSVLYLSGQYGRCHIPYLNRSMFSRINHIDSLYLSNCSIVTIEQGISEVLPNIRDLDLSWNTKLGFDNISVGLQGSTVLKRLKKLNLNSVYDYYKFDACSALTKQDVLYLKGTAIEVYTIESNNLVRLDYDVIPRWPKTLKYLSVRDNMLMYGVYVEEILQKHVFKNLIYYDASQVFLSHTPNDMIYDKSSPVFNQYAIYSNPTADKNANASMFTRHQFKDYFQILDERLTKFNITRDGGKSGSIAETSNKIEYLDLSENMPGNIMVALKLFEHSPYVKVLNLSKNYLGYELLNDASLFTNYSSLRVLDLSSNTIIHLLPGLFRNQTNLQDLYLSNNKITNITFILDSLKNKNLKYLDLGSNHIESIPDKVCSLMDSLAVNFTINIVNNSLRCTCDNLGFVSWVKHARITFQKLEETRCTFENGSTVTLDELVYEQLHNECLPPTYYTVTLIISLCILTFIIIVSCGLIYRFKWNLRYLYYMTKFKLTGGYQPIDGREFEKDVFVSYANEDRGFVRQHIVPELEEDGDISLLVHDRDFLAGEYVADNILRAVSATRRTLVILTNDYIRSKWCMYEMNMARMEAADTGRNVLCVILKEDIPVKYLPIEIIDVIKKKTYMEFPTDHQHVAGFWDRLRATLKHDM